ncbi:hypothetical protein MFERI15568_00419 [Mycoplasma feriruminatoris]|uniref:hypothetical protein n=1 Tax=Mycoplasma feriruminatoris TaxID=1179777 RepID=UPI00241EF5C8|nr:hypothetical protein [Mycoplasma feriruminatoris]WFQ95987.1 hypothetical protein MFERI15568_00419 [Mycoplasma feriruminatoris]
MEPIITKSNQKLDDSYKAALILIIIGCSFTLLWAIFSMFSLIVGSASVSAAANSYPIDPTNHDIYIPRNHVSGIVYLSLTASILLIIASIPTLITIIFAAKSLKNKTYKYKVVCGVMGIIFGLLFGIIGGVFALTISKKDQKQENKITVEDLK